MEGGKKRIALLGTGLMGYPVAEHLLKAGYPVTVYNRTKSKALPLADKGAHVVDTAEEALKEADAIICFLFDFASVRDTVGPHASLLKGKFFAQCATIGPNENLEVQKIVEDGGGMFLESPVLGTRSVAVAGTLQVLVGCTNKEHFEEMVPVFSTFGKASYVGAVTAASTLKLALNQIVVGQTAVFANSLAMIKKSEHLGLNEESFMNVLRDSALYSKYFDIKRPLMSNRDYSNLSFDIEGAKKDTELIAEQAAQLGVDTAIMDAVRTIFVKAAEQYPNNDFAVIYNVINPPEKKD